MSAIRIKKSDRDIIVAHAKSCLPNEACGLIAGRENGAKTVERVYMMTNTDATSTHFNIDPREQLTAVKDMRRNGISLLGNFHSHPETPARPSEEDIRLAFDPSASYLILSLAENEPVLRAFRIEGGAVSEEDIEIL